MGQAECSGAELDGAWHCERVAPCPAKKDNFSWGNTENNNKSKGKITANVFKLWSWSSCCSAASLPLLLLLLLPLLPLLLPSHLLLPPPRPLLAAPAVSLAVIYNFNLVVQFSLSWLQHNEPNTSAPLSPLYQPIPLSFPPLLLSLTLLWEIITVCLQHSLQVAKRRRQSQRQRLL